MEEDSMLIDRVVEATKKKKNPCIVGLDPEWEKLPECYKVSGSEKTECILQWAKDIIDVLSDIVVAVKPQMAFYEVYGAKGLEICSKIIAYAHSKNLIVIDDSKRNDIGNTARAYAYAHLATEGAINTDFMTVSPFLGRDSIEPFVDTAIKYHKGIFVLVKTSNPGSIEISDAVNSDGKSVSEFLAEYVCQIGERAVGESGYSTFGAVVGATFPKEAEKLRQIMRRNYFLVPGYGAQGGSAKDIVSCFNPDGLGALVSSSRGVLYHHTQVKEYDGSKNMYLDIVRKQAQKMQQDVYAVLKNNCSEMEY